MTEKNLSDAKNSNIRKHLKYVESAYTLFTIYTYPILLDASCVITFNHINKGKYIIVCYVFHQDFIHSGVLSKSRTVYNIYTSLKMYDKDW